ncbi:PadR family transcriptional regulator [Microbacterium sp. CPCC 204701]|uniref:PadR family transcriptional regulator n=1 Tax=Microbacterium sp. CPCC 204701 TaxID=2493084 RepID=UPI000FDAC84F|nr:PadR family transcriptional regulator [Microbacterium sp. CPCC 204701]
MQQVILGLLILHGPLSLYAVQRQFQRGISLFYSASFGSIQRALRQLADRGLATVGEGADARGSKPYAVTDAGYRAWHAWMLSPLTGGDAETAALARVFFLGVLTDDDERRAVARSVRARIDADLAELEHVARDVDAAEIPDEFADVFVFQRATLDYGIRSNRLALQWCDELDRRLGRPPGEASSRFEK